MKFNVRYVGLVLTITGIVSLSVLINDHETTKFEKLFVKIEKLQTTIHNCEYSYEKFSEIEEILQNAQTKLLDEKNYDDSQSLVNLATAKLFSCEQYSSILSSYLLMFPIFILMILFGIILFFMNQKR